MSEFWEILIAEDGPGNSYQVVHFDGPPLHPETLIDRKTGLITKERLLRACAQMFAIPVDIRADFTFEGQHYQWDWSRPRR